MRPARLHAGVQHRLLCAVLAGGYWLLPLASLFDASSAVAVVAVLLGVAALAAVTAYALGSLGVWGLAQERFSFELGRALANSYVHWVLLMLAVGAGDFERRMILAALASSLALGAWLGPVRPSDVVARPLRALITTGPLFSFNAPNGWTSSSDSLWQRTRGPHRICLATAASVIATCTWLDRGFLLAAIALTGALLSPVVIGHVMHTARPTPAR